ncbi:MAG: exo-alpha-sialidase [Planctomycetaceae bacterium]|nr:exo-alpha-sialidase [Planctomycetaceae bacterium]
MLPLLFLALQDAPRFLDLSGDTSRRVVVDRQSGQYLGHPTTALLGDGRTILCAYPEGHGRGAIRLVRSEDGGASWSKPLPVPASFATSLETPTLHRFVLPDGRERVLLFSGLNPARLSHSDDGGRTWTELAPAGNWGGIVVMSSVARLADGSLGAFFHDDGRFLAPGGKAAGTFTLLQSFSKDLGLSWSEPEPIWSGSDVHLCEPGIVRSPDGARLALLLRENRRAKEAHVMLSDDEARTWGPPRELNPALTGDRHVGVHALDGRLVVTFRDMAKASPTRGDWLVWVGRFDDLERAGPGEMRVRLADNHHEYDCGYAGLELLPDGTFVATSYGHWTQGEKPYVISVRFTLAELDRLRSQR